MSSRVISWSIRTGAAALPYLCSIPLTDTTYSFRKNVANRKRKKIPKRRRIVRPPTQQIQLVHIVAQMIDDILTRRSRIRTNWLFSTHSIQYGRQEHTRNSCRRPSYESIASTRRLLEMCQWADSSKTESTATKPKAHVKSIRNKFSSTEQTFIDLPSSCAHIGTRSNRWPAAARASIQSS